MDANMDAPSNIPVAFRPIYHTFSNSWYIILCRCFYTKTRPFPFLQVAGRGFALQGGNLSAQLAWSRKTTPIFQNCHGLSSFIIIHHHSLQFFPYVPLQWHAMTILIQFGNIRGIFGVYHRFSLLVSPLITMTSIFGRQHSAHHGTMAPWRCLGDASMPRQWPRAISHTPAFIFASRHPWLCLLVDLFICYIPRINC